MNCWRMYTVYASSRTSSQQHSKMQKLFHSPEPTVYLTAATTDQFLSFLWYLSLLRGTFTNTYSNIWKTINSSTHINLDSVIITPVILAINSSEIVGTVFLDFKKAFDLVDHSIPLKKLSLYAKDSSSLTFFILILQTGHNMFFFLTTSHLQRD